MRWVICKNGKYLKNVGETNRHKFVCREEATVYSDLSVVGELSNRYEAVAILVDEAETDRDNDRLQG